MSRQKHVEQFFGKSIDSQNVWGERKKRRTVNRYKVVLWNWTKENVGLHDQKQRNRNALPILHSKSVRLFFVNSNKPINSLFFCLRPQYSTIRTYIEHITMARTFFASHCHEEKNNVRLIWLLDCEATACEVFHVCEFIFCSALFFLITFRCS